MGKRLAHSYFENGTISKLIAEEMEIGGDTRAEVRNRILNRAKIELGGEHDSHTISSGMTYVLNKLVSEGYVVDSFWKITN